MSQIIFPINHLPPVIDIGKQTEKGVTRIGFDVHEWLDDWPGMKFSVQPVRPGEKESYLAATDMVGSVIFWLIGATDTERAGSGTVEVLGVTEDERKLSAICRTAINETTTTTTAEIPEPGRPWVDQVILAGESAKADAKAAEESAQEASQAATAAGQHAANADEKAAAAAESAASAEQARDKAIAQAEDAEASAKQAQDSMFAAAADASKAEVGATNAQAFSTDAKSRAEEASASASAAKASASAAKSSETAAATSERTATSKANNASTSATVASQNASVASSRAKEAAASATAAQTSASNAAASATAAATSESNAKASETAASVSANAAEESAAAAKKSETAVEAANKLFIVTVKTDQTTHKNIPDKTADEVLAAVAAGKTCLLTDGIMGHVYTYAGKTADGPKFAFIQNTEDETLPGLWLNEATMLADGTVRFSVYTPVTTPNPRTLTITGAVEAEYNGSADVVVEIPAGGSGGSSLPETADPLMQLVTDQDGKVGWAERLAYKTTKQVENLAATKLTFYENGEVALLTPWAADVVAGAVCTVNYNGTDYGCLAIDYNAIAPNGGLPAGACVLGNLAAMGGEGIAGSNADAPFAMITMPNALSADMGAYAMFIPLDGATSATIAVSSVGTTYKTIDSNYLPDDVKNENVIFTVSGTLTGMASGKAVENVDKTFDETWAAIEAGRDVRLAINSSDDAANVHYFANLSAYGTPNGIASIHFTVFMPGVVAEMKYTADGLIVNSVKTF